MGIVVEAPIPRHITGIYVFAVVNLVAMLCISRVDAEIIVIDTQSNETAANYPDIQAKFGPDFPSKGLEGRLVYAEPDPQACGLVKPPPSVENKYLWILLVARGGTCQFSDKVLNAQRHNYSAVIVHNYDHKDGRIPMGGGNNGSRVRIPSTFVGWTNGMDLRRLYDYTHREYIIRVYEDEPVDYTGYLWSFLLVLAVCILMVMIFLLLKFLRDYANRSLSRLSNKHLKKIPVRKFKKGDYYDTCAICLEEYEEGEKIRVLPCDHVYHRKCIDPWLTKNKKTCPVCKRRVIPGRDADSESGSEVEGGDVAAGGTENTPLLSGRSVQPRGHHSISSVSGTTVVPPVHGSDLVAETGAVGGAGISDRTCQRQGLLVHAVSVKGSIQAGAQRREVHTERKRKRRDRDWRTRREEEVTGYREEEAAGSSVDPEMGGRREKRKKKKDKKKEGNRSSLLGVNEVGTEREKGKRRVERNIRKDEESNNSCPAVRETSAVQTRNVEGSEHDTHNTEPCLSDGPEGMLPAVSRRREMNEVV